MRKDRQTDSGIGLRENKGRCYRLRLDMVAVVLSVLCFVSISWGAGGDLLWFNHFDQGLGDSQANAIAVQGSTVYAAGHVRVSGGLEWVVRAYDAMTGDLMWHDQFTNGGSFNDALAITVQGSTVYAAGVGRNAEADDEWIVRAHEAR